MTHTLVSHSFPPFIDNKSRILILGSFPSVKSREAQFYYMHPQNRFWRVLTALFHESSDTLESKKQLLTNHHIALYDVIESCSISGSSDSSIKDITPASLEILIKDTDIHQIYCVGKKAYDLYLKYQLPKKELKDIPVFYLPSTSPANAVKSLEELIQDWSIIL